MAHSSVSELMAALQKSGLPFDNGANMGTASLTAGDAFRQSNPVDYSPVDPYRENYRSQLDQIAQLDQKLASTYADPKSNLFIENPGKRENIYSKASGTGYKAASQIQSEGVATKNQITKDYEQKVSDAVSLYKTLTTLQDKEEKAAAKAAKTGTSKGTKTNQTLAQVKKGRYDLAGLVDPDAIAVYERAPADFQKQWVTEYQTALNSGDAGDATEQQYTANDIKGAYDAWNQKTALPKAPKAANSNTEKISALKKSLGL